jgi:methanesulfonate monooxygenase large subunit|tara:strand:+ start:6715 stop:7809 length:1095 start_codon:yes stop_codon:yes gene_type:complete
MPAQNHKSWLKKPDVEYVDSRIYSDHKIWEEEIEHIFSKVWIPMCHKSELREKGDFRTSQIAFKNVIAVNHGNRFKVYLNDYVHEPSGNFQEMYTDGLVELPCEVEHGGMIWTTIDRNPTQSLKEWINGAFDCITEAIDTEELEVFHYHKAIIPTNYKLWHDTNSEFYHDYMHYFNRTTGFNEEYFARKCTGFDNGHVNVGSFEVQYTQFDGAQDRGDLSFPGLPPNQWYMVDLFPGFNFNLRGSAYRSDSVTPLGPNSVLIEFRGYGLLKDTPEERKTRIEHHNTIWGPFGRNLHEDLIGVTGQGASMSPGSEPRRILHGRHENETIHDEVGMRHYYQEWAKFMDLDPTNPVRPEPVEEEVTV